MKDAHLGERQGQDAVQNSVSSATTSARGLCEIHARKNRCRSVKTKRITLCAMIVALKKKKNTI